MGSANAFFILFFHFFFLLTRSTTWRSLSFEGSGRSSVKNITKGLRCGSSSPSSERNILSNGQDANRASVRILGNGALSLATSSRPSTPFSLSPTFFRRRFLIVYIISYARWVPIMHGGLLADGFTRLLHPLASFTNALKCIIYTSYTFPIAFK